MWRRPCRDAGKIGQVFTVGLGTPQSMKPYLEDGSSSASILWDVEALGYLTAWAGLQLAEGNEFEATNDVSDDLPEVEYDEETKVLLLGPALRITDRERRRLRLLSRSTTAGGVQPEGPLRFHPPFPTQ